MAFAYFIAFFFFCFLLFQNREKREREKKETGEGLVCLMVSKGSSHSTHLGLGDVNGQCVFVESN